MKTKIIKGKIKGVGAFSIFMNNGKIERAEFSDPQTSYAIPFDKKISKWIKDLESGRHGKFPYKFNLEGTEFQRSVWKAMQKIPFGEVRTYKWIAEQIGRPRASRAVGNACGANPIPLIIPCHRVVGASGLGGFSCGLHIKKKLLDFEQKSWTFA